MSASNVPNLTNGNIIEAVDKEIESNQKVESTPEQLEKVLRSIREKQSRIAHIKPTVDLDQVVTNLKLKESATLSQWQTKLIKLCNKINDRLKPRLKNLKEIGEELTFPVVECKSGQSDNLVGSWLMTIRLAIGKLQFPAGNNDTVAKECWEKLSDLACKTVLALQTHKSTFKNTVRQLEFVHDKYVKYTQMVGRPTNVELPPKNVTNKDHGSNEHSIPDRYVQGICSASVAVFERDIILVHDQDKTAPIFHMKDSAGTGNYSRCIEILKLFIEQTTGMMDRSYEKMLSEEKEQKPIPQFLRNEMADLLALCLKYDQAHRLQERLCASSLKIAMRSLNETIRSFLNHTEEIKLMCIWVLTAVEACFDKIKESWPCINFVLEQKYRDKYKKFQLQSQQNPWWHPKRFFGTKRCTFWEDISENVGKFEKYFRRWGTENLHLINLRVSIPVELSSLLFVENERQEVEYLDSPGHDESEYQVKSFYSEIFVIEAQTSPPPCKGRRHHLSHVSTSVEEIEMDLDEHAAHPTLDSDDLFPRANHSEETSEVASEPKSDPSSFLASPKFSVLSNTTLKNADEVISGPVSGTEVLAPTVSAVLSAKSVHIIDDIFSNPASGTEVSAPSISVLSSANKSVLKWGEIISNPVSGTEVSAPTISVLSSAKSFQKRDEIISSPVSGTEVSAPTDSVLSSAKSVHKILAMISNLASETDASYWNSTRSVTGITSKSSLDSLK